MQKTTKPPREKRTAIIVFRCTQKERDALETLSAEYSDGSISAFLRMMLISKINSDKTNALS